MAAGEGTLAEHAEEIIAAGELPDDPDRALDALVNELGVDRPDTTVRGRQLAAARALGMQAPATSRAAAERRSSGGGRRRRRRRRGRVRVPKPLRGRVAKASTLGALIAQSFGLIALYWVLRSGGAIQEIVERARSAVEWLMDPVGWGDT